MKHIVFIHGRSQQDYDSLGLKQEWLGALRQGFEKCGYQWSLADDQIRFPYYGDTLYEMCKGFSATQVSQIVVRGQIEDDAERQFASRIIIEAVKSIGVTDEQALAEADNSVGSRGIENWPMTLGFLRVLDKIPGFSSEAISVFTHDVYMYLRRDDIAKHINSGVAQAFQPGIDTIVVAHSLGTIVGYNILRLLGTEYRISHLITLGSPLGLPAIQQALAPLGRRDGITWMNARDEKDLVALYPLTPAHISLQPIENANDVANATSNHHGITGYLSDPTVARWIHDALR